MQECPGIPARNIERLIVVENMIVENGDVGAAHHKDVLEVRVLDFEAGDEDIGDARVWSCRQTIDEDAVPQPCRIDDRLAARRRNEG